MTKHRPRAQSRAGLREGAGDYCCSTADTNRLLVSQSSVSYGPTANRFKRLMVFTHARDSCAEERSSTLCI